MTSPTANQTSARLEATFGLGAAGRRRQGSPQRSGRRLLTILCGLMMQRAMWNYGGCGKHGKAVKPIRLSCWPRRKTYTKCG